MANYTGSAFTPPDVIDKVTGKANYADAIHVDGMVFARLLTSPVPHARIRSMDLSEALAMDGVVGVLTADDVPESLAPRPAILTNKPVFVGDPILAIAAVDETIATNALQKVKIDFEPLPFCVDPLESLEPAGSNARVGGNVYAPPGFGDNATTPEEYKWTQEQLDAFLDGQPPDGDTPIQWSVGDIEEGFERAAYVIEHQRII